MRKERCIHTPAALHQGLADRDSQDILAGIEDALEIYAAIIDSTAAQAADHLRSSPKSTARLESAPRSEPCTDGSQAVQTKRLGVWRGQGGLT